MSTTDSPFERIRNDEQVREGAESLAKRDTQLGAIARVMNALADGRKPDPQDCRKAGLPSLIPIVEGES